MLEQILCYRALGVSLEEISRLLSATNTEKEQVLQRHLIALSERKSQIELFIKNVSKTILLLKGDRGYLLLKPLFGTCLSGNIF